MSWVQVSKTPETWRKAGSERDRQAMQSQLRMLSGGPVTIGSMYHGLGKRAGQIPGDQALKLVKQGKLHLGANDMGYVEYALAQQLFPGFKIED